MIAVPEGNFIKLIQQQQWWLSIQVYKKFIEDRIDEEEMRDYNVESSTLQFCQLQQFYAIDYFSTYIHKHYTI